MNALKFAECVLFFILNDLMSIRFEDYYYFIFLYSRFLFPFESPMHSKVWSFMFCIFETRVSHDSTLYVGIFRRIKVEQIPVTTFNFSERNFFDANTIKN